MTTKQQGQLVPDADQLSPGGIFRAIIRGSNIMTPRLEGYGRTTLEDGRRAVYEIASGTGLDDEPIYGVTFVVEVAPGRWEHACLVEGLKDLDRLLWSDADAQLYVVEVSK